MLKPYDELVKIDVKPYCDTRKAKDDNGKTVDIPYLNWATCKKLLHENGASTVYYTPVANEKGSFVFCHYDVTKHSTYDGKDTARRTECYFVKVQVHIDENTYVIDYPLMNGNYVVYEETLDQLRISNALARAFVKGVAIHTGLGFSLWSDDVDKVIDDLSVHDIFSIRTRIEHLITEKMKKRDINQRELCDQLNITEKQFENTMRAFASISSLEMNLKKL